jgi:acetyltransferase
METKMDSFFNPSSVAVVGASPRKGGAQIIQNLLYGYQGAIYPVNPRYEEIQGLPCFPSINEIPHAVDLVIIFIPAHHVPPVLEGCAQKGIKSVMIESAGFSEVGSTGRSLQHRCLEIANASGIRIWGPNCMGLVDVRRRHFFTFMNPRVYQDGLIGSSTSLVVQSGMLSAAFLTDLMGQRAVGVGKVCSIGNKADVDECDLLRYLLEDRDTEVIAFYLESMRKGRLFAEMADGAQKPIVILKGGRSQAGAKAALSHTSSLAGNSRLAESVLATVGVTLAEDFHQMVDIARTLASTPETQSIVRTAILTFSGGAGIVSCDLMARHGLHVAQLSDKTLKALEGVFPPWMPVANPVDLYPAMEIHGRVATFDRAFAIIAEDPQVDALLIHYVAGLEDEILNLRRLKQIADAKGKTVLFWLLGSNKDTRRFRKEAQAHGITVHGEISRAVECLAAAARFHTLESRPKITLDGPKGSARSTIREVGSLPTNVPVWDEFDSKRLLAGQGVPVVEEALVHSLSEAEEAAIQLKFPVVLKGLMPGQIHKTEKRLVRLGIENRHELVDAFRTIRHRMEGQGRILMQHHMKTDYELIAGFLHDDQFGPCLMFGFGGILAELDPDVVFVLAPVDPSTALGMIKGVRGKRLLEGFRGIAPLEEKRMTDILVRLSDLGVAYPQIAQIDVNPLGVSDGKPFALDATVILKT